MRIISKHHDFYDSAMAQGQDRELVYVRERVLFADQQALAKMPEEIALFADFAAANRPMAYSVNTPSKTHRRVDINFGMVLLAGKIYPFAEVRRAPREYLAPSEPSFFSYEIAPVLSVLAEHGIDGLTDRKPNFQHLLQKRSPTRLEGFFKFRGDERFHEHALIHQLPCLSHTVDPRVVTVNPRLADLQFFRCIGPFEAYQELSMFLGNIAAPDRIPVIIDDKYKIPQHGFDQYSFRKRPAHS